jgi:hypothetical protein
MKYQNTSGFRQTVIIGGKKTIVFADDIISVEHELFNAAFDRVADNVEPTFKERQLKTQQSHKANESLLIGLQDKLEDIKKEALTGVAETNEKSSNEINELRKNLEEFKGLVIKRMEILKSALQNVEGELEHLLYVDDSTVVEDKQDKPFRVK